MEKFAAYTCYELCKGCLSARGSHFKEKLIPLINCELFFL
uniref:Uncharacterized protein n=1 Tax=Anguilla anguilla TaxID=7936 RepID=A0A0E9TI53_ANGAN